MKEWCIFMNQQGLPYQGADGECLAKELTEFNQCCALGIKALHEAGLMDYPRTQDTRKLVGMLEGSRLYPRYRSK